MFYASKKDDSEPHVGNLSSCVITLMPLEAPNCAALSCCISPVGAHAALSRCSPEGTTAVKKGDVVLRPSPTTSLTQLEPDRFQRFERCADPYLGLKVDDLLPHTSSRKSDDQSL